MNFTLSLAEIKKILDTESGDLSPRRKMCGKCDYYDTIQHAGLKCSKCGGEPVSVDKWLVFNVINRAKAHFRNNYDKGQEVMWVIGYVAQYLEKKHKADFYKAYGWAFDNHKLIKSLYLQAIKDRL